ncbi:tol-Pal system protein TolR [Rubritalea halochordaticola]|uniref:Tol-Pal system protein TolR n=1 Tax=Rubritalea halochordaticola TaxID=714537 RepID=A0ABP9UUU3_9BACT
MASSKSEQLLKDDKPMMDISSLIDVCFLLLIFFLVTSTILPTERDLMLKLPDGRGVPSEDVVINLSVDAQGQIKMKSGGVEEVIDSDSNNRNLPKLVDRLQLFKMAAGPNDVVAMIDVDDAASQQRFIDVMNCLAGEEVTKVAFTARD